jgi:hypothetical protein
VVKKSKLDDSCISDSRFDQISNLEPEVRESSNLKFLEGELE